jgi:hypothetical protein
VQRNPGLTPAHETPPLGTSAGQGLAAPVLVPPVLVSTLEPQAAEASTAAIAQKKLGSRMMERSYRWGPGSGGFLRR